MYNDHEYSLLSTRSKRWSEHLVRVKKKDACTPKTRSTRTYQHLQIQHEHVGP